MQYNIEDFFKNYAKSLEPGGSFTISILKGHSTSSIDPVHAERVRREGVNAKCPEELHFPRIAKFGETINKPDFKSSFHDGRMYEEDIPRYKDESDEDMETFTNNHSQITKINRRKKKWKHDSAPKRHWIIQERAEFIEKIRVKKLQKKDPTAAAAIEKSLRMKLSKRYEGIPEYNPSQYAYLSISSESSPISSGEEAKKSLMLTPIYGFHSFLQPYKYETLSMKDAELAIKSQRDNMSRYMMNGKFRTHLQLPCQSTKTRLMHKLSSTEDSDIIYNNNSYDIMGDIAFRTGVNETHLAHHELISSFVDGDVTVDGDGILGGANDAEFGGRRKFSKLGLDKGSCDNSYLQLSRLKNLDVKEKSEIISSGFDGCAMEDNFYQRDVSAEYNDMDYDPNELFDDDDLDQGAVEVEDDICDSLSTGIDEEEDDDDVSLKNRGFESSAGTRLMLAKHDPDHKLDHQLNENGKSGGQSKQNICQALPPTDTSCISPNKSNKRTRQFVESGIQYDKNGERVITLDSVRREIWLHRGSMGLIQLMKVYKISRKNQQRKNKLREIVRELCTLENDQSASGTTIVLKQHYANMS